MLIPSVIPNDVHFNISKTLLLSKTKAVLFEVAAIGAKIRNTHKVSGERVKEMQFFVQSVETPGAYFLDLIELFLMLYI